MSTEKCSARSSTAGPIIAFFKRALLASDFIIRDSQAPKWLWLKVVKGRVEHVVEQDVEYEATNWSPYGGLSDLTPLSDAEIQMRVAKKQQGWERSTDPHKGKGELTFMKHRQNLPGMAEANLKSLFGQPDHDEANATVRKLIGYVLSNVPFGGFNECHWLWIELKNGRVTRVLEEHIS